jgi:pimeloyl-ACP methyl ester carboxylesterase
VRHRFDNRAGLAALQAAGGRAWIFHGSRDEVIPVEMSRTLAAEFPQTVTLKEVPNADHNSIVRLAVQPIMQAMGEARRP